MPTVWKGVVRAEDILGYFGQRRESEVVLDPATVEDVKVVWTRRRTLKESA